VDKNTQFDVNNYNTSYLFCFYLHNKDVILSKKYRFIRICPVRFINLHYYLTFWTEIIKPAEFVDNNNVLKLIDEISEVLSLLIELKKKGRFREALERIDKTLLEYFHLDSDFVYSVSEDFFIDALKQEKKLTSQHLSTLAELLSEHADILLEQNNLKQSRKVFNNTLRIYYFLNEKQDFFSFKNMNKMVLINDKLAKINVAIKS